ncbi:MAG: hypothetical protein S4CHLAM102_11250 [Chlamydiia bacterium]|nr:hypothetical protein [Chlamydiia bacterium]
MGINTANRTVQTTPFYTIEGLERHFDKTVPKELDSLFQPKIFDTHAQVEVDRYMAVWQSLEFPSSPMTISMPAPKPTPSPTHSPSPSLSAEVIEYTATEEAESDWNNRVIQHLPTVSKRYCRWIIEMMVGHSISMSANQRKLLHELISLVRQTFIRRYKQLFTTPSLEEDKHLYQIGQLLSGFIHLKDPTLPILHFHPVTIREINVPFIDCLILSGKVSNIESILPCMAEVVDNRPQNWATIAYVVVLSHSVEILRKVRPFFSPENWFSDLQKPSALLDEAPTPPLFRALTSKNTQMADALLEDLSPEQKEALIHQQISIYGIIHTLYNAHIASGDASTSEWLNKNATLQ